MRQVRTYFNTSEKHRPNQLPDKVEKRLQEIQQVSHGLYRVVEAYSDMVKTPVKERIFGMLVSVVRDAIPKLNRTYMFIDADERRDYSNNQNWQIYSNKNNEILGLNGQYFKDAEQVTITHGLNRWPIQYVLIDEQGNEIYGRVQFINHNMFRVEFDGEPISGYVFYYL